MRDHSKHIQVDRYRALELILENSNFTPQTEWIPIGESVGRILAEDICSRWDAPNCLTCRMDSVAVHWDDFKDGMPDTSDWVRGVQWEFANTGVAMPEGFDTAIVVEHVIFSENEQVCRATGKILTDKEICGRSRLNAVKRNVYRRVYTESA